MFNKSIIAALLLMASGLASAADYRVLDEDLTQLQQDFNAHRGQIRLMFIVGPTCGICLRGMADLNDEIIAAAQNDPRLQTFVVHVPALGAEEKDVAPTLSLLQGPRIQHYWDGVGHIGRDYEKVLGTGVYAWDVWMIYGPDETWEPANLPPPPKFWQHQLGHLDNSGQGRLDKKQFAAEIRKRIQALGPAKTAISASTPNPAGHAKIIAVAQGREYILYQHLKSRGGYRKLKSIQSVSRTGHAEIGAARLDLQEAQRRPNALVHTVTNGNDGQQSIQVSKGQVSISDHYPGAFAVLAKPLLAHFDFDSWLVDWRDKGYQVHALGMQKRGDKLLWLLHLRFPDNSQWHLYLDSHTGNLVRAARVQDERETIAVEYADYRKVNGFQMPYHVRYWNGKNLVESDVFAKISIMLKSSKKEPDSH